MAGIPSFSADPSLYPDPTGRADKVRRFINNLELWEGPHAGKRFGTHPFQDAIINRIYGPIDDAGDPLVRTAAIWIPRGNAKTTLAAGLGLAHFMGPERQPGGQIIMAAADRENAGIAFTCAHQFVIRDRALKSRVQAIESQKLLKHRATASRLKAISSEAYSKHGLNPSFFLADEIHSWAPAEGRKLFKTVEDGMGKREGMPVLTIIISTAGEGTGGLAHDWWKYSIQVASGEIDDPAFAPIIFAADPEADWRDEDALMQANPAIAAGFCSLKELRTKKRRIEQFPAEIADFRRFHLNQWQEGAALPWLPLEVYDKAEPRTPLDALEGRSCYIGVDLASVEDMAAVVAVFPQEGDDGHMRYDVVPIFFLPAEGIKQKSEDDRADYLRWSEDGDLILTEGNTIDYRAIIEWIVDFGTRHNVVEIAIDRWNSQSTQRDLSDEGFTVVEFGQGYASMSGPMKELKRAILKGHFRHGGNPVLRSCFGNAIAEKDPADNEKLTKAKSMGRIDGAVAAVMAVGRVQADFDGPFVYDDVGARPDGVIAV